MFICDLYTNKSYIIIMYWCGTLVALAKIPLGMFFFLIQKKCVKEIEGSFGILEKFQN